MLKQKIAYKDTIYQVNLSFNHSILTGPPYFISPDGLFAKGKTRATITVSLPGVNRQYQEEGYAWCSIDEPEFNRATGRKIALTRALEPFPKKFRKHVWNFYHQASNKPERISHEQS